jgi:hypothetical protein
MTQQPCAPRPYTPELAYGDAGDGKLVPPKATLFLYLELVAVGAPPKEETLV